MTGDGPRYFEKLLLHTAKNNRQQFIAAGTNPKVVELKVILVKVAPFNSIMLLYSLCTSNCN